MVASGLCMGAMNKSLIFSTLLFDWYGDGEKDFPCTLPFVTFYEA